MKTLTRWIISFFIFIGILAMLIRHDYLHAGISAAFLLALIFCRSIPAWVLAAGFTGAQLLANAYTLHAAGEHLTATPVIIAAVAFVVRLVIVRLYRWASPQKEAPTALDDLTSN